MPGRPDGAGRRREGDGDSHRLDLPDPPQDGGGGLGDLARTGAEVTGLLALAALVLLAGFAAVRFARRDRSETE